MKKIPSLLYAVLFVFPVLLIAMGCGGSANSAKSGKADTSQKKHPLVDIEQPDIYVINVANSVQHPFVPQGALTVPNSYIVVGGGDDKTKCSLIVNAVVDNSNPAAPKITIAPGSTVYMEDRTGNCPDNCDIANANINDASTIKNVLNCDPTNPPLPFDANTNLLNNLINNYVANGHSGNYNVLTLKTNILTQLFADHPDVTVIVIQITAPDGAQVVNYAAYHFDLNQGWVHEGNNYTDNNPVLYKNTTTPNK